MNLEDIQSNLRDILEDVESLAGLSANIFIDDGQQDSAQEAKLKPEADGIALLIMKPQCVGVLEQGRHWATLEYTTTIWLRTNPAKKVAEESEVAKWDVMKIEREILTEVLTFIDNENQGQQPFTITEGGEPETDFSDQGNDSRLIRFATKVTISKN